MNLRSSQYTRSRPVRIYGPPKGFPFLESGQNSIFPPNNRKEPTSAPSVGIPDTKWSSSLLYVVVVAGPCTNQTEASISRGSHGSGHFRKRLCNTKSPKSPFLSISLSSIVIRAATPRFLACIHTIILHQGFFMAFARSCYFLHIDLGECNCFPTIVHWHSRSR
jgi:hypothetical protein